MKKSYAVHCAGDVLPDAFVRNAVIPDIHIWTNSDQICTCRRLSLSLFTSIDTQRLLVVLFHVHPLGYIKSPIAVTVFICPALSLSSLPPFSQLSADSSCSLFMRSLLSAISLKVWRL